MKSNSRQTPWRKVTRLTTLAWVMAATGAWAHDATQSAHAPETRAGSAVQTIEQVMKRQFDKPQSPLRVNPVSVEGNYALAGWTQDQRGGRALLKQEKGQWAIELCAGDGLKQVATLTEAGLPSKIAQTLIDKQAAAERKLPADMLKKFSLFEGMVKVDGGGHGAHGEPGAHKP